MPHTANIMNTPFFRDVLTTLRDEGIPFVVGGAYGLASHTGIHRTTKDLDLLCRREDLPRIFSTFADRPYRCEHVYSHWLAKIYYGQQVVDIAHSSGNGVAPVDDFFFTRARRGEILGIEVPICPVEELLWTKAFVMERERFDGADVAHLLRARARDLDWSWLLQRFGNHYRLLLSHLVMYGYVYPQERQAVPAWVMEELIVRLTHETQVDAAGDRVCLGTLLSREQYLVDIARWNYLDGRVAAGTMSPNEIEAWTRGSGQG